MGNWTIPDGSMDRLKGGGGWGGGVDEIDYGSNPVLATQLEGWSGTGDIKYEPVCFQVVMEKQKTSTK